MELKLQSRASGTNTLHAREIEHFSRALRGELITPESGNYDEARSIWNAMIDRRPGLIVRCADAGDVARTVRFCRDNDLLLAVRGGGHNIAGHAICADGVVIDLSRLRDVEIDAGRRTARVEAGATLGEFDGEAQKAGLATPLGINSTTGVAGLTLGGGFGWLSRKYGLTIDNLLSVDLITEKGEKITANKSKHADLFWGVRGGGGNFGVVTEFEYRLHEVGPTVLAGLVVHPLSAARDVLRFYRDFMTSTPEEFVCWFVMRKAPPLPFLDSAWHGREILALAMCYCGEVSEGERIAEPLRKFGRPLADVVGPTPFTAWQAVLDPLLTPGMRNYWKTHDFRELSDGLIEAMLSHAERIPDPQTEIAFAQLGGAVERVAPGDTAYTHRDARFVMNVHGRWADPAKDAECIGWARSLFEAAGPYATGGAYVNFLTQEEQGRVQSAYGANYRRLADLKKKYDPTNLFRTNQNIVPTA